MQDILSGYSATHAPSGRADLVRQGTAIEWVKIIMAGSRKKDRLTFKAALYLRLSREDGDKEESDSIGNQRKLLKSFLAAQEDMVLAGIYIDDGYTGTNFNRPNFRRMLSDIEDGLVNCVIVKDLSRFGRDYLETGRYIQRYFPEKKVRFIAVNDRIDSKESVYDLMLPIKNLFNEQYARDISAKVQSSFKAKQRSGEFVGAFPSYGYQRSVHDRHKLIIDPYAANIVRRVFNLYVKGYGKVKIAHILNEEEVLCPTAYKRANGENYKNCNKLSSTSYWTYSTINHMLKNEMYLGNMVQGKTRRDMHCRAEYVEEEDWIIVKNTHPAIIDRETWDKVQSLLKRNARNLDFEQHISIFAGFLKCGDCGRAMSKKSYTDTKGRLHYTFRCGTYSHSGSKYCTSHMIQEEVITQIVLADLNKIIRSVKDLEKLVEGQSKIVPTALEVSRMEIEKLSGELEKIRRRKREIYEDFKDDLISKEEYISYREDYLIKEKNLDKKIRISKEEAEVYKEEDIFQNTWIRKLLDTHSIMELTRDMVVEMIDCIQVYEGHKIKIVYNFSDELESLLN